MLHRYRATQLWVDLVLEFDDDDVFSLSSISVFLAMISVFGFHFSFATLSLDFEFSLDDVFLLSEIFLFFGCVSFSDFLVFPGSFCALAFTQNDE